MKKKFFFIVPIMLGLLTSVVGFSMQNMHNNKKEQPSQEEKMMPAYNAPSRTDVKGAWDFYVSGSFIYWRAKERGLDFAVKYYQNADRTVQKLDAIAVDEEFDPGFKVALGLNSERDNWDIMLQYTRLYNKASRMDDSELSSESVITDTLDYMNGYVFRPYSLGPNLAALTHAEATWKLYFNILDFELGRAYHVGKKLSFRPFVGVKAGWIDQDLKGKYLAYVAASSDLYETYGKREIDTWLLGSRFGMNTHWDLGEGFRLFANISGSLFYQHFHGKYKTWIPEQHDGSYYEQNESKKEGFINYNFETCLGFGWESYFSDDEWHVDITAGYEFQVYADQNYLMGRYIGMVEGLHGGEFDIPNLSLQGLTVSLKLDF